MNTKLSLLDEVGLFARASWARARPCLSFLIRGLLVVDIANSSCSGIGLPAPWLCPRPPAWLCLGPEWLCLGLVRGLAKGLEKGLAKGLVWLCLRTLSTFCRHSVTLGEGDWEARQSGLCWDLDCLLVSMLVSWLGRSGGGVCQFGDCPPLPTTFLARARVASKDLGKEGEPGVEEGGWGWGLFLGLGLGGGFGRPQSTPSSLGSGEYCRCFRQGTERGLSALQSLGPWDSLEFGTWVLKSLFEDPELLVSLALQSFTRS